MSANSQVQNGSVDAHVLRWAGRVLTSDDVRRHLNGHRELLLDPRAVITPLAEEELRNGSIHVRRAAPVLKETTWGFASDRPYAVVQTAAKALERDGLHVRELRTQPGGDPCGWAVATAECVSRGECQGGVVFCQDPGLVCCLANKVAGLRSVAVVTVAQAARATLTVGANLIVVEMPGRTFFEVRQIFRTVCGCDSKSCPPEVARTLEVLERHANR